MNKHVFKKTAIAALMIATLTTSAWAAGLQAQLNTGTVAVGDSFQLILSTGSNGDSPDLSPLSKDFEVRGTSQSSQVQIINGRRSESKSWIITLSPKHKGELTIPAISAGAVSSEPTILKVVDASEMPKSIGATGISVTATLDADTPYIYQEIPLKIRIETNQSLQEAALVAPEVSDFELTQQGDDVSSQVVRNGQAVNMIERNYLLRPQKSGALTLPPFVLQGAVADPNARQDPFAGMGFGSSMMRDFGFGSMFAQGKPFKVRSDAIELTVLANPQADKNGWFLPAKQVKLEAQWSTKNPEFKVGEAVTRQISLLALGARPEQLPELQLDTPSGAKLYLDNSATQVLETTEGSVARRDILVSVVPTTGGDVVLPEIKVQWHDTESKQQRTAVLPAETIHVAGTVGAVAQAPSAQQSASLKPDAAGSLATGAATEVPGLLAYGGQLLPGLLGLTVLGVGGLMFYRRRQQMIPVKRISSQPVKPEMSAYNALLQLQKAVNSGDARKSYDAVLRLQRTESVQTIPDELDQQIQQLETHLFREAGGEPAGQPWDAQGMKNTLNQMMATYATDANDSRRNGVLPPLYPASN